MAVSYHVNGPALCYIGPQLGAGGGGGGLLPLGYTEDGADIELNHEFEPIMGDVGGPSKPQDLADMGADASIRLRLLSYDLDVLDNIRGPMAAGFAGGPPEGSQGPAGALVGSNNNAFRLVIASATDEPWRFYNCVCRGAQSAKIGVRKTVWNLQFYAWTFIPAGAFTRAGLLLYDHVNQ